MKKLSINKETLQNLGAALSAEVAGALNPDISFIVTGCHKNPDVTMMANHCRTQHVGVTCWRTETCVPTKMAC